MKKQQKEALFTISKNTFRWLFVCCVRDQDFHVSQLSNDVNKTIRSESVNPIPPFPPISCFYKLIKDFHMELDDQRDDLRLRDVNPIYGREISYSQANGTITILFSIARSDELCITDEILMEMAIPCEFQSSGGTIIFKTVDTSVFIGVPNIEIENDGFIFPWLKDAKYPLSVWFFTARNALVRTDLVPWSTPFEIRRKFPSLSLGRGSRNTQEVNISAGAGRTRGRRPYMEDVDFVFDNVRVTDRKCVTVFGVLDGHGGKECAQFASDEIPMKIATLLRSGKTCEEALFMSFLKTDTEYLKSRKSSAGCTACVMLWESHTCSAYIANTGDTRAVLCRSGRAIDITRDKKATDPDEIARIAKEGGFVAKGRVMGSLAVARALGDGQLKDPRNRILIADPEVTKFRPHASLSAYEDYEQQEMDEFIIIATDGLWDVLTSQAAVSIVREDMLKCGLLTEFPSSTSPSMSTEAEQAELSRISDSLAKHAVKALGSQDNVTVMILNVTIRCPGVPLQEDAPYDPDAPPQTLLPADAEWGSSSRSRAGSVDDSTRTAMSGSSQPKTDAGSSSTGSKKGGIADSSSSASSSSSGSSGHKAAGAAKGGYDGDDDSWADMVDSLGAYSTPSSSSSAFSDSKTSKVEQESISTSTSSAAAAAAASTKATTVYGPGTNSSSSRSRSSSCTGNIDGSSAAVKSTGGGRGGGSDEDDDMLDFLLDDSNF